MGKKMGAPFSSISRWLWTGKNKLGPASNKSPPSEYCRAAVSEFVTYASPSSKGTLMTLNSRNGMRVDAEYDAVLVQLDADGISESESGELDWSIGWLESFSPEFQSDDENDASYAVLVPCYKPGCMEVMDGPKPPFGNVIKGLSCDYSAGGRKYMEQWLSSRQGR